jgi:hypothetical protein
MTSQTSMGFAQVMSIDVNSSHAWMTVTTIGLSDKLLLPSTSQACHVGFKNDTLLEKGP